MYGDQEHQDREPMDWTIEETTDGDMILLLRPEGQDDFTVPITPAMIRELVRRWTHDPQHPAGRAERAERGGLRSVKH